MAVIPERLVSVDPEVLGGPLAAILRPDEVLELSAPWCFTDRNPMPRFRLLRRRKN